MTSRGDWSSAEADATTELGQERPRQQVGAAVEVHEVGVVIPQLLPEQLQERRVHERLLVEQEAEHLDRALRPLLELEELAHGEVIVLGRDRLPSHVALDLEPGRERLERAGPQLGGGAVALMVGDLEAEAHRIGREVGAAHRAATGAAVGARVVHRERLGREPEAFDERHREEMRTRDPHRAGLGPQPGGERLPQREHPAADALLSLEHDRLVPGSQQLRRRHQPGHARPDDEHSRGAARRVGRVRARAGRNGRRRCAVPAPGRR